MTTVNPIYIKHKTPIQERKYLQFTQVLSLSKYFMIDFIKWLNLRHPEISTLFLKLNDKSRIWTNFNNILGCYPCVSNWEEAPTRISIQSATSLSRPVPLREPTRIHLTRAAAATAAPRPPSADGPEQHSGTLSLLARPVLVGTWLWADVTV